MCQFNGKHQCHGDWELEDKKSLTKENIGESLGQDKLVNKKDIPFSQNILLSQEARFTLKSHLLVLALISLPLPSFIS